MKPSVKLRWKPVAVIAACVAIGLGAFIGVSAAASGGSPSQANTAGTGGHAYSLHAVAATVSASNLPAPAQAELAHIGAISAAPLASVGSGANETDVYGVTASSGAACIEVTHAGGTIAEPPNCTSNAYLRVWSAESGTGDPEAGTASLTRVIAAVSTEVKTVRVSFADGSSRDFTPDGNGLVVVQTAGGQALPTSVSALDAAGVPLATMGV